MCSYSLNDKEIQYNFKMKVNLIGGRLKEIMEKINENILVNNIINNSEENKKFEIEFIQDIWVPILINVRKDIYRKIEDFPFAFCSFNQKISEKNINYLINKGFELDCNIDIPERKLLIGNVKIRPFYDYLYMKINKQKGESINDNNNENENEVIFDAIYFNINKIIEKIDDSNNEQNDINNKIKKQKNLLYHKTNSMRNIDENDNDNDNETMILSDIKVNITNSGNEDIEINDNSDKINSTNINHIENNININNNGKNKSINNNNIGNNENNENKENNEKANPEIFDSIDYFLLNGKSNKIYCPDKPIFTIKNSNKDIILYISKEKEYTIMLKGYLSNGLQEVDNKIISIIEIYDSITFSLTIIDNLAEDEDDQRAEALCTIPANTLLYKSITVLCTANKISEESMQTSDTDITLNWNLEKNILHNDIIIRWPDEKKKYKHMYSYTLNGFSLVQTNYGCYNNEFYFYIYIFDLNHEPDISFELVMKNPMEPKAICKLYESSILRCYFPLYQQRLEKNTIIDLPINYTYSSVDARGNKVIFIVDDYDDDYEDMHLTVRETCGDYFIVGALKKAGLDYFKIFLIVIGIAAFAFMVFICFICFVCYKIKHINRKGQYIRHIEEDFMNEGTKEKNFNNKVMSN